VKIGSVIDMKLDCSSPLYWTKSKLYWHS